MLLNICRAKEYKVGDIVLMKKELRNPNKRLNNKAVRIEKIGESVLGDSGYVFGEQDWLIYFDDEIERRVTGYNKEYR